MSDFKAHLTSGDMGTVLRLSGQINEYVDLDPVKVNPEKPLEIDLSGVTAINSTGLRTFKHWSETLTNNEISLSYCPKIFIDQLNMILALVPAHAKISSFYVPYCSDSSGEEKYVLYTSGEQYSKVGEELVFNHPEVKDSTGDLMVLDVLPRYFAFLSRHF
jgi:ABC-type transporter Mla MlaB component